ncbi:aldose epimerase family protein [Streptomyces sp. NPDC001276]|uniref:aldose epimerase family protein n=1 Tax=Streptomyces sp. NPDC001276 TaxID=3364555 RepID=UPI0036A80BD5
MPRPALRCSPFGTTPDGTPVERWHLDSGCGVRAEVLTYGGILHALEVPDRNGVARSVVLSLTGTEDYAGPSPYLGALVGRYANRIADGRFTLDGRAHQVPVNDRGHALHGGPDGFDRRIWTASPVLGDDRAGVRLTLRSPDGDMGFPGTLDVTATYVLDARGTLALDYRAVTDRPTVVNLTNHAYFNLSDAGTVTDHTLLLDADRYLPLSDEGIPYGPSAATVATPFDFTRAHRIGARLHDPDPQLRAAGGYDHCWVLRPPSDGSALRRAARLEDPGSGRAMEVWTTEPGLQVYTGNQLDGTLKDAAGRHHERYAAVCLETQHLPDSPNHPEYPSTELRPGSALTSRTEYRLVPGGTLEEERE